MTFLRRDPQPPGELRCGWANAILMITVLFPVAGCSHMIWRGQNPDHEAIEFRGGPDDAQYIGEVCAISGFDYAVVEGIALVTGLDGTGSDPKPSGQREHLANEMRSHGVADPNKILRDVSTSLVVVQALVPPAARKGDRFDVRVGVLPGSETTSLQGGFLMQTRLRPLAVTPSRVLEGHVAALARGPVMVNALFDADTDDTSRLRGTVLGGGIATEDRPLGLAIHSSQHSLQTSSAIGGAINQRFTTYDGPERIGIATPKNDRLIELKVPSEYRFNIGRFVQVIGNMAYGQSTSERLDWIHLLEAQLNEPATAARAALRLEGFGTDAVAPLRRALRHDDVEVRFHAAQALAYMQIPDGVEQLQTVARLEPAFRWHALTALASLNHSDAEMALAELMSVDSAETRYGAFLALHRRAPENPLIAGKWLANDYYLHTITTTGKPMIHFSRSKRPEIVVFGDQQTVSNNFLYVESGLTIRSTLQGQIEIIRYLPGQGEQRRVCSNRVVDLIQTLAEAECDYATILSIFKDAAQSNSIQARMVIHAVPTVDRTYDRDQSKGGETSERFQAEPVPELFADGELEAVSSRSVPGGFERPGRPEDDQQTEKGSGFLDKMKWIWPFRR